MTIKLRMFFTAGAAGFAMTAIAPASAQTAEEKLNALDSRITHLEDMNQIERVQRTYGYFVDKGQWTPLADLFTDDATLEIGGKGIFTGKDRVLEYMQGSFGKDGTSGSLVNHMQFQTLPNVSPDGKTGWMRSRAYVMSGFVGAGGGSWGLPLYENAFEKGDDGQWRISRLSGPFTMYADWETGWRDKAWPNTWPDKFGIPPDLPPSVVYLTYPGYYIIPYHYPNPVTGKAFAADKGEVGAYQAPPGTPEQEAFLKTGRTVDGTQPIANPPRN